MTDEEWAKQQQWLQQRHAANAAPAPAAEASGDGWMGTIGAGLKGAAKEATGWTGLAPEWAKSSDKDHSTAEWVGREGASLAPMIGLDFAVPEIGLLPTATRLGRLANTALNAGVKGAAGGAAARPDQRGEGAQTGGEIGATSGAIRAGWGMLPVWAKTAAAMVPLTAPSWYNLAHELGGGRGYLSPWAVHHAASALAAIVAAAAKMPSTAGAVGSQIENWWEKPSGQ